MLDEYIVPDKPWLTKDSVKLLDQLLKNDDVGVEFGSGRSTLYFAKRLKKLTSVEDNLFWYTKINTEIIRLGIDSKIDYRLLENLDSYASIANSFSDESIDFCLIDGKVRDKCALGMFPKLKPGGLLVIDNVGDVSSK